MIRVQRAGLIYYRFESLSDDRVIHGMFTRLGGASHGPFASLNVGHTVGDDPANVAANHAAIYQALGTCAEAVVTARQVHGNRVAAVSAEDGGKTFPETDALISNVPGLFLLLRFADCVPIFLTAPKQGAVGLAHAGWQGTLQEIAIQTVRAMAATFGCRPEDLRVGLGPAIGPCCFEVGPEVIEQLRALGSFSEEFITRPQPNGHAYADLWQANASQLRQVGVQHIEFANLCTSCHLDEFYSHRAERGLTGRLAAVIGLREG